MKSPVVIVEAITRLSIAGTYIVRVWTSFPEFSSTLSQPDRSRLRNLATSLESDLHLLPSTIGAALLALPDVRAVEIADAYGQGIFLVKSPK